MSNLLEKMKKNFIVIFFLILIIPLVLNIFIIKAFDNIVSKEYRKMMSQIKEDNENFEIFDGQKEDVANEKNNESDNIIEQVDDSKKNVIGVLTISKLNVKAPIKEGTSQEILRYAVGHFVESDLWNGNVALASHNRGSFAKYFKDINKLEKNDEIIYSTEFRNKII